MFCKRFLSTNKHTLKLLRITVFEKQHLKTQRWGKSHRTRQYTAGEKKGHWTVRGTNIPSLSPCSPPPGSGDQLFSAMNTHVSTSGSLNYTYYRRPDSWLLISNYAKGVDSLGPEHKSARSQEGGWSADSSSPPAGTRLGFPAKASAGCRARAQSSMPKGRVGACGLGLPGSARRGARPARPRGGALTPRHGRGAGGEAEAPTLRPAAPPQRPKRSRAAEAARASRGRRARSREAPSRCFPLRGRKARSAAAGGREAAEARGWGWGRGGPAVARPRPRRNSPAPPTSATTGSERKMVAAPPRRRGPATPRGGTRRTQASLPQPLLPHGPGGHCGPRRPVFRAALLILVAAAAAQGPRVARLVGTVRRRKTPQPSACGDGAGAGAGSRHVTALFTVPGPRRACAQRASRASEGAAPPGLGLRLHTVALSRL